MAHHRHQASLEGILDFSTPATLSVDQRERATRKFHQIIGHFDNNEGASSRGASYNRPRLIQLTYEYALSEESRDLLLRTFFHFIRLDIVGSEGSPAGNREEEVVGFTDFLTEFSVGDREEEIRSKVAEFADYLMDNFYLPRKVFQRLHPLYCL